MGVPVAGGFRRELLSHDPRNERTRCSAWVQTEGKSFIIDVGPEFRIQSIRAQIKSVDHVLITHEHMDHIGGLDDLRVYNFIRKSDIPVYATKSCLHSIRKRFDYMFGKNKYPGSTSLDLIEVNEPFNAGGVNITPLPAQHGDLDILGYRINDFSYLTDVKHIPSETMDKIRGSEVMVLSALRWEPNHPTHLTIPDALDIIEELGNPTTYLIHMNSYIDHEPTNRKLPGHVKLAFDQLSIRV